MRSMALVFFVAASLGFSQGSVYDCWDPEKLQRMQFKFSKEEASDPGLAQFSKMVKCLSQQQGGRLGSSLSGPEWNQFNTMPGMQFVPNWNNPNANRPRQQQPNPGGGNWPQQGSQPRPGVNRNDWRGGVGRPGVQQQQWPQGQGQGGLGQQQGPQQRPYDRGTVWGKTKDREEDQDNNERNRDKGRRRNRNRQDKKRGRNKDGSSSSSNVPPQQPIPGVGLNPDPMMPGPVNRHQPGQQPGWTGTDTPPVGNNMNYQVLNPEESASVSLTRKYGYALMALSVVVLAVIVIFTVFCCGSSNSTMNQAATATAPGAAGQFDNYSIYSYGGKGGAMNPNAALTADTLRSTGTLGGMSLAQTETLKSTRSVASRASPQYRVSDIDPDFARRFRDNQQY